MCNLHVAHVLGNKETANTARKYHEAVIKTIMRSGRSPCCFSDINTSKVCHYVRQHDVLYCQRQYICHIDMISSFGILLARYSVVIDKRRTGASKDSRRKPKDI